MISQVGLGDDQDAQVIDETSSSHTQLIQEIQSMIQNQLGSVLTKLLDENRQQLIKIEELSTTNSEMVKKYEVLVEQSDKQGVQISELLEKKNLSIDRVCVIAKICSISPYPAGIRKLTQFFRYSSKPSCL